MGLKSQIVLIKKANKLLRREAGDLERERDNYRNAYNDLLRKQMEKRTGIDLSRRPVTKG